MFLSNSENFLTKKIAPCEISLKEKVNMAPDIRKKLNHIVDSTGKLSNIVESWLDENGEIQPEKFPVAAPIDDIDALFVDLDSACADTFDIVDGILRGRRDSTDLNILLGWRDDIFYSMSDLTLRSTKVGLELAIFVERLFDEISATINAIGDKTIAGRRDFYIYVHKDKNGKVFYVGKGTKKRAWAKSRHPLWHKYVEEHLNGIYEVEIVQSDLAEHEAESAELELMKLYPEQLVNWDTGTLDVRLNTSREGGTTSIISPDNIYDSSYFEAMDKFHQMRDETRRVVQREKEKEKNDPDGAIVRYREAVNRLAEYVKACPPEPGLKGEVMGPWMPCGVDLEPLDRLTILLLRQGKIAELITEVDSFFQKFPGIRGGTVADKIWKRREKASSRCD